MNYTDILTSIRKIVRSINLESKRIEKEHGISIPQLLTLNYLRDQPQFQASQKEIKDFLSLNASTVTGIINRLERKGLIAKLPRKEDRRISFITLTAKGSDLVEQTPAPLHERLSSKLDKLSPEQLKEIQTAFHTIADLLDADAIDASPIITGELHLRPELENNKSA